MKVNMSAWSLSLLAPGEKALLSLPVSPDRPITAEANGVRVTLSPRELGDVCLFEAAASAEAGVDCYFSLTRNDVPGEMLAFFGPIEAHDIYRQSPHDPKMYHLDMQKQAVPMAAAKVEDGYEIALSDAP